MPRPPKNRFDKHSEPPMKSGGHSGAKSGKSMDHPSHHSGAGLHPDHPMLQSDDYQKNGC